MRKEAKELKGREGLWEEKHGAKLNNTIIMSQAKTNTKGPQLAHRTSHHRPNQSTDQMAEGDEGHACMRATVRKVRNVRAARAKSAQRACDECAAPCAAPATSCTVIGTQ